MNELATTERNFTADQVALIKSQIAVGCTDAELQLFLYTCRKTGVDPLARQIYAIKRGGKMTIQTGIDGYRVIADRTGKLAGISDYTFDLDDTEQKHPNKATVSVTKLVGEHTLADFTATARWGEYNAGGPMWQKMPYLMLGKCAEALALRKAFPADLSGVYTAEEMAQADNPERGSRSTLEVERQKSSAPMLTTPNSAVTVISGPISTSSSPIIPPELDFEYVPASGLLICRIEDVVLKSTSAKKEYVLIKPNQSVGGASSLFYWHNTHRNELLAAKGKVVKMMVTEKPKGITVDVVLEIDGKKVDDGKRLVTDVELSTELKAESDARLLASFLEFSEEELREAFSTVGKASWTKTFQLLKDEKARREA